MSEISSGLSRRALALDPWASGRSPRATPAPHPHEGHHIKADALCPLRALTFVARSCSSPPTEHQPWSRSAPPRSSNTCSLRPAHFSPCLAYGRFLYQPCVHGAPQAALLPHLLGVVLEGPHEGAPLRCMFHVVRRKLHVLRNRQHDRQDEGDGASGAVVLARGTLFIFACGVLARVPVLAALVLPREPFRHSLVMRRRTFRCTFFVRGDGHRRRYPALHAYLLVVDQRLGVLVDESQLLCLRCSMPRGPGRTNWNWACAFMRRRSSFATKHVRRLCLHGGLVSTDARNSESLPCTSYFVKLCWIVSLVSLRLPRVLLWSSIVTMRLLRKGSDYCTYITASEHCAQIRDVVQHSSAFEIL